MSNRASIESPRLQALKEALGRGDTGVLESFWDEMRECGTPLIEPIEGDDESSLATFVWQAREPVIGVSVISLITGLQDNHLTRLLDTDAWYRSWPVANDVRATYQFFPQTGASSEESGGPMAHFADYVHDPLNPKTYVFEKDEGDPDGFELTRSVLELPNIAPQPLNEPKVGVPAGTVERRRLRSEILENERRVWVYTPAGYDPDRPEPYDVLVLFDGTGFVKMSPFPTILDNLVAHPAPSRRSSR